MSDLPAPLLQLVDELAALPGAVAVVLGGSRATGTHTATSDWDLGLLYRSGDRPIDPADVRALGRPGRVSALGEWGPIVNGGAWLTVGDLHVDVLFRDLDVIDRWAADARAGVFEILPQTGYLAGAPTYLPVGELAIARPLRGSVHRPAFPDALAHAAPPRWIGRAEAALLFARQHARVSDPVACTGMLALAVLCAAHARMAGRQQWVLSEKRLVDQAGLGSTQALLGAAGATAVTLTRTVESVTRAIGVAPLER